MISEARKLEIHTWSYKAKNKNLKIWAAKVFIRMESIMISV